MTILKKLVAVNGEYTTRDGSVKKSRVTIGHLHSGQYGDYITLEAHVNLAAFPRKDGDTRVMVNLYDNERRDEAPKAKPVDDSGDFEDSQIPF